MKHVWVRWGAGVLLALIVSGATAGVLTATKEHETFAHALRRVNDNLRDGLAPSAAASVTSADMSAVMAQIGEWYTAAEWPAYDERQEYITAAMAGLVEIQAQLEDYCDESVHNEIASDIKGANESLRFLKSQKDILTDLERAFSDDVIKSCANNAASAGILTFYIDALAAESHQVEIYDSDYQNTAAIEALGSFTRRYETEDDVPYIKEAQDFMGEERFGRYFAATGKLYTAVYSYAHETDESKFEEGFANISRLQSDLQAEAMLFQMYLSQAVNRVSGEALEQSARMHEVLSAGADATGRDTHFSASVTTAYVLMNAISDFNISRSTVPDAASAKELADGELRLRLRDVPVLVYDDIKYTAGGSMATLTLTLDNDEYDFIFVADEPIVAPVDESRPV